MHKLPRIALAVDLLVILAVLGAVLLVPIAFLVPYNDEWLRMNYLATHSVWEWTVMHMETWVVRPTCEIILALCALPITRPALAGNFTPEAMLARFHAVYVLLVVVYLAMFYVNAAILARTLRALPHTVLLFLALLTCWFMASELQYAFYFADGYGNILMPFSLCCCGLPLLMRESPAAAGSGAVLAFAGAFGHEVIAIYTLGVLLVALVFRRPLLQPWRIRALWATLFALCLGVLLWQLFGTGPSVRAAQYLKTVGKSYNFETAWLNVREIHPLRAFISVFSVPLAIAIYRDRLGDLPDRARADFSRQRWFWILLALGTLLTACLPLAGAGLKKGRLAVSYYSVFAHLLFALAGALLYPIVARWLDPALAAYRRRVASLLPIVVVVVACSGNIAEFREAVTKLKPLRAEAFAYMHQLFDAPKTARVRLCRPRHPYSKPPRMLTDRNEQEYFGLQQVRHRCPR